MSMTDPHPLPAPPVDPETQAFWHAAAAGQLMIGRCTACGELHYPPRALCPLCLADAELAPSRGEGEIYTFSIMRKSPTGPYAIGYVTLDEGVHATPYRAAELVCLNMLASLKAVVGDLDRVTRIVKVLGMVNSAPGFSGQPQVINGCSDLLVEVFGQNGRHARSAVGMAGLPGNIPVEIELILEVEA